MPNKTKKNSRKTSPKNNVMVGPVGTITVPRGPSAAALPVALRSKALYFGINTLTAGAAGLAASQQWRSSSLFDPDYTFVGAQPAGFAALATLYSRYRVIGSRVKLTIVNDCAGSVYWVAFQSDVATLPATLISAQQQPFKRSGILSDQSGGKNQATIRFDVKPWQVMGVTKERYFNDDQFAAAVTANPALVSFVDLFVFCTGVAASVQVGMEIEFDAVLFDRVYLV